jgi:hypothetical protein
MIIVRLLFSEPVGWFRHHQLYLDLGADIVMESISLIEARRGEQTAHSSAKACFSTVTLG